MHHIKQKLPANNQCITPSEARQYKGIGPCSFSLKSGILTIQQLSHDSAAFSNLAELPLAV